ncbi:MAG: hypothetical protein GOVbin4206_101 [Prokaryotic dsDNA virus sp.]|nr:MAG: hypothetical protein GOVbin4206_101 [Prokaryotic dsDNA virus sp.]|tara:strand:- start:5095 stop:5718 length:624 start_codon:yes stop_codon:yes gene_type:complete
MSYVYLKTKANKGSLTQNVIPLNVTSVSISTDKQIPSLPVPVSGLTFGEATTAALDLGMSSKTITLQGFIMPATITKNGKGGHNTIFDAGNAALNYTAHEIAQMIASGVDSTGAAIHQAFDELVFLIPSTVDETFTQVTERNIPWTFHSRGEANELDNYLVPMPSAFPTSSTSDGVKGFIRQFGCDFTSDTVEVSFNMQFEVATVFP